MKSSNENMLSSTSNTRSILPDSKKYIRSDVPINITEKDKQWLLDNNIRTIIDLRENDERNRKPCPLIEMPEFDYFILPVTGGNEIPVSPELVPVSYINMVDEQMDKIIRTIERAAGNVLYFCNAGKDRTGVVSAILLKRMGKSNDYIISDYMKSAANLKSMLEEFVKNNPEVDRNIITPKEVYMKRFLKYLEAH